MKEPYAVLNTADPLRPTRVSDKIREMTNDSQMAIQAMSGVLNHASFMRAIQLGYELACEDFGKPKPEFADPIKAVLERL